MIIINDQAKKFLKIFGIVLGILIVWGIFNLFKGNVAHAPLNSLPQAGEKNISSSDDAVMDSPSRNYEMSAPEMMVQDSSGIIAEENSLLVDKKIIKNGSLDLRVEKTETAVEKISQIVKGQGGEVFSTNFYEPIKGQKSGSITLKVPVEKFEETISKIKEVATQVFYEVTSGQDVTEQYSDLQAQLKNKKAEEESFVKILERAGEIEDVLKVTQQIARVRGEIERLEGRIRFMDSQTDMSTIVVNLSEDIEIAPISKDWRPIQVIKKSFSELIDNMQGFVDGLIRFAIVTLPSFIVFLAFVWALWLIGKKIYGKFFRKY